MPYLSRMEQKRAGPRRTRCGVLLCLLLAVACATLACSSASPPGSAGHASPDRSRHHRAAAPRLHVSGNRLVNGHGRPVLLHGVDRSGAEFMCVQGHGIFDGPART